jgi:hypothetical protein
MILARLFLLFAALLILAAGLNIAALIIYIVRII